jgi:hypothetical protein
MSWDTKKGTKQSYYYRCERRPGCPHPVKIYLGKGPEAEAAARDLEERKQAQQTRRAIEREALLREELRVTPAEESLKHFQNLVDLLIRTALQEAGYYEHRGEWRRMRRGRESRSDQEG